MLSFKSLGIKKQILHEESNTGISTPSSLLKGLNSPSQSTSNTLSKKKYQAPVGYSSGYGIQMAPSQLFEQYSSGSTPNSQIASSKQQSHGAAMSYLTPSDKQVGLPAQQHSQQLNEEKRSKSSGLANKNIGKTSKNQQLTPLLNASQYDEGQRGKSSQQSQQQHDSMNAQNQQQQQVSQQQQQQQQQQQHQQQPLHQQQGQQHTYLSSATQSQGSLKVNLYSQNINQFLASAGVMSKTNTQNIFHRKSNSTQLNKNFFEQSSNHMTYLGDSISTNAENIGITSHNQNTKSKIKVSNYQGLNFGNSNYQIDSTRNSTNTLNLNQSGVNSNTLTQYRTSKNGFLSQESNSEVTTPKTQTISKLFVQNASSIAGSQNNENIDYLASPNSTKGERFPSFNNNSNIINKPSHHRINSDKVYKQIHQTLKNQTAAQKHTNKQPENQNNHGQNNGQNLEYNRVSEGGENSIIENRAKELSNQLKQSHMFQQQQLGQSQQAQQQQQQQKQQNLSQLQQSQVQLQQQQQNSLMDYSQIQYLQKQIANNSQNFQNNNTNQKGNETNDIDEAATTTTNSHTNGSPLNKNAVNVFTTNMGFKDEQKQSLNNSNTQNSFSKQNSFRNSNKGLSLDSGSTPQPKFDYTKSPSTQMQQIQYNNYQSQQSGMNSPGLSNMNSPNSQNTAQQNNHLQIKLGQNGQIHLYTNKAKKSISSAGVTNTSQSSTQTLETLRKQFANTQSPLVQQAVTSTLPFQPLYNNQISSSYLNKQPSSPQTKSIHNSESMEQTNTSNFRKTKENITSQGSLYLSQSHQFSGGSHKKNAASLPGYTTNLYNVQTYNNQNANQGSTPQKSLNNSTNAQQIEIISSYCVKSKPGSLPNKPIKTNQDSYIVFPQFANNKNKFIFSVCDGHGSNGHLVSQFIKKKLPIHLESMLKVKGNDYDFQIVKQAIISTYQKTAQDLSENSIDTQFSGSTSVLLYINSNRVWCANLGDSRAICAKTNKTEWNVVSLSIDQKPDNEKEKQRILSRGGRVEPYRDFNGNPLGPYRVWLKNENMPGLAMARSFGDQVAQQVGVISEPEVNFYEITEDDKFLVIASDGVWEFLSNEKVVSLVTPYYLKNDAEGASERLIKESTAMWKKEDDVVDDITAIVVFLNRPQNEPNKVNLQDSTFINNLKRTSLNFDHS